MSIGIITPGRDVSVLRKHLREILPAVPIQEYPDLSAPESIEMVILWKHPRDILSALPNVRLIHSLGAGVDHLLSDSSIPAHIPICRIVDADLRTGMTRFALLCVLNIHKSFPYYFQMAQQGQWGDLTKSDVPLRIGVMGLGELGKAVALQLSNLGFPVKGYSFSRKEIKGIKTYAAAEQELDSFLEGINCLINVLPLTAKTEGILNARLFKKLGPDGYIINMGRGAHLQDEDLLKAIDAGHIKAAYLDVFREEPLPAAHSFWSTPQIVVTPHIASLTNQESAARQMADNYERLQKNEPLQYEIKRKKGY